MRPGAKGRKGQRTCPILPAPRRDGGTGRRGGLKIRCPKKACGFDSLSRHHHTMNFCSNCGTRVVLKVPEGDFLPRHVCDTAAPSTTRIPSSSSAACRSTRAGSCSASAASSRACGFWTIPAGFMENGETLEAGAAREAHEEARTTSKSAACCCWRMSPMRARCTCSSARACARRTSASTHESLEVKLVDERDIPWDDLAFPEHRVRAAPFRGGPCRRRRAAPRRRDAAQVRLIGQNSAPQKPGPGG